jgi:hypothetical protein
MPTSPITRTPHPDDCGHDHTSEAEAWACDATIPCQVQGHEHLLTLVSTHTQHASGATARMLECPTGRYRFFHIDGYHGVTYPLSGMPRYNRPRWGWPS